MLVEWLWKLQLVRGGGDMESTKILCRGRRREAEWLECTRARTHTHCGCMASLSLSLALADTHAYRKDSDHAVFDVVSWCVCVQWSDDGARGVASLCCFCHVPPHDRQVQEITKLKCIASIKLASVLSEPSRDRTTLRPGPGTPR